MTTKTIDLTATWSEILPALLLLLESPNAESRKTAEDELWRMSLIADKYMAYLKGGN